MAAPRIRKSEDACLRKIVVREKSVGKLTKKNILCPESLEWPRPALDIADQILSKLSETLKNLPNIFKCVKKTPDADQGTKKKVRSQLEIGVSAVFRALEKDSLACVLVSGQAKPSAIVDHVIALARERSCPLLCLDSLSTTLAVVTKSKVLPLCVGFKILPPAAKSDFVEVMDLICENTKVSRVPVPASNMSAECTRLEDLPAKLLSESFRPVSVDVDREKEIIDELKRILSSSRLAGSGISHQVKSGKKKKKAPKRNLKDLFDKSIRGHFEMGKRTATEVLERGKVQLILVSLEIVPFLMTESSKLSLLKRSGQLGCPVICIPGLTVQLLDVCDAHISVIAFKKVSSLPQGTSPTFQRVIDKCLDAINTASSTHATENESDGMSSSVKEKSYREIVVREMKPSSESNKDVEEIEEEDDSDFSYLHIMKNDSAQYQQSMLQMKRDVEMYSKEGSLSGDYISLGERASSKVVDANHSVSNKIRSKEPADSSVHGSETKSDEGNCSKENSVDLKQRPLGGKSGLISFNDKTPVFSSYAGTDTQISALEGSDNGKHSASRGGETTKATRGEEAQSEREDVDQEVQMDENVNLDTANEKTVTTDDMVATNSTGKEFSSPPLFTISRKGDLSSDVKGQQNLISAINKKVNKRVPEICASILTSSGFSGKEAILGGDSLLAAKKKQDAAEADHIRHVFDATSSQGRKKRKRKHGSEEGLISLGYTEANIHTMVCDVNKKRKKKKK